MDPQQTQALMAILQQMSQGLQQAMQVLSTQPQPQQQPMYESAPYGDMDMDEEEEDMPYGEEEEEEGYNGDPYMAGGAAPPPNPQQDMPDQGNLHERLRRLEAHTGLKKSATGGLVNRVAALEREYFGVVYRGDLHERLAQLEEVALSKTAREQPVEEAPRIIPLDELIKTAVQQGIEAGLKQAQPPSYPDDLDGLRKSVRRRQPVYHPEQEADEDLDRPPSFGDVLLAQYHAQKQGDTLFPDDDDE